MTKGLSTFADAEAALQLYIPIVKQMTGKDITLDRMRPLMAKIGNPESRLKVIHVAGTSGKTSTAYYIAGLLKAAGQTIGLTISPHIDVISERLQVNLEPVSEAVFCRMLTEFLELAADVSPKPSYFELLIAMAYWYFDKISADFAVIETGFGGLHDASNICQNEDKICVLTDIGFDHMHILGHTLPEISLQKAGIMHRGNLAITFEQPTEVLQTFKDYATQVGARLEVQHEPEMRQVFTNNQVFAALPDFQKRNWLLAFTAYSKLADQDDLPQLSMAQLEDSMHTYVPGRMDVVHMGNTKILMDGAHNEQKMTAFVNSFQAAYPGQRVPVILGMKTGKEYQAVLPLLKPITSHLIVTSFTINQDLRSTPIDPTVIAKQARIAGFTDVTVEPDTQRALDMVLKTHEKLAVVAGSFYLLANIRRLMLGA